VREKRDAVIEKLLASPEFIEHSTNKWADLLQVNSKFLGKDGAELFREWIRQEMKAKTPYDEFARKILTASGSNKTNPAASYWKILRDPVEAMENTTHLFLATRFNCNKCHDYPFERWTQDQYYHTAALSRSMPIPRRAARSSAARTWRSRSRLRKSSATRPTARSRICARTRSPRPSFPTPCRLRRRAHAVSSSPRG